MNGSVWTISEPIFTGCFEVLEFCLNGGESRVFLFLCVKNRTGQKGFHQPLGKVFVLLRRNRNKADFHNEGLLVFMSIGHTHKKNYIGNMPNGQVCAKII